ncbi:pyridoxal phosphate-dependent transferase [Aspergillus caelatus]|uniref:Pyridoxal phosphate-dependent transferase n=1 Tax=Aspergillus caelatus TaxID=61420 RepID=A0A5N7ANA6_9EURO|nr:pyridoxal phosphate-dependent transferase [Aspergillus caelatus]KAE8370736.1 pyridoxal phosphate-dependent transferase [Aspergillus caelatus]
MWILNQLLLVISIGFVYVEAVDPIQDYLSPRASQANVNGTGWRTLNQTVLSKPYDPKAHPRGMYPISEYDFIVASGVTSLIDSLTWRICSDNEAIIIPRPLYNGFPTDMRLRSNGTLLPASFMRDNETVSLEDAFNPTSLNRSLEKTLEESNRHSGKASKEALMTLASFCGRHRIHFISDEIYANSVFPDENLFTSVLSLNLSGIIDPNLVHVMYGMSKDFGASGLRLGALHSRNQNLIQAAAGVNLFSWPSYLAQDMWARLLQNETKTNELLSQNRNLLNQTYSNVTSWLDRRNITYFRGG